MPGDWVLPGHTAPKKEPPAPTRLELQWRVAMGPSGRTLSCGLYAHPRGVEARCGYRDEDDLIYSRVEPTLEAARARAGQWLDAILAKGSCEVLWRCAHVCTTSDPE